MPLEELNKKIYDPNVDLEKRKHEESQLDPTFQRSGNDASPFIKEESWQKKSGLTAKQKKLLTITAIALVSIFIVVGLFFGISYSRKTAFQEDRVSVILDGPRDADSAQSVSYLIKIKNSNRTKLKDAEILLNYSENFQPSGDGVLNLKQLNPSNSKIYIGEIKSNEEKEIEVKGVFYAPENSAVFLNADLKYKPASLSSEYLTKSQISINIETSPIFLELVAPLEAAAGDNIEYVIDYKNLDKSALNDAQIKIEFPEGFQFNSSDPVPSQGNNVWYFGVLDPDRGGKIRISGKINGLADQNKTINVQLGRSGGEDGFIVYNKREKSTKIVEAALVVSHELSNNPDLVVNPGEALEYIIKYNNKGQYVLKDVIISLEIKSEILDVFKVKKENGHFDIKTGIVTWKASDIPQLASLSPNTSGEVRFSIATLEKIPIENSNDKNFIIKSRAKIDSSNFLNPSGDSKIIYSDDLDVKLNSKVIFDVKGFYTDSNLKNEGPLPLTVGNQTSYSMHWSIVNISNDITNAKVVSSLPSGVKWTGRIYPSGEKISYNERTNEIIWEVDSIAAGAGIYLPKKEVSFQIGIVPQENQAGEGLKLLNVSIFTAKDSFTNREIFLKGDEKTTWLPEDNTINANAYKVAEK